jgi:hypothetical protein
MTNPLKVFLGDLKAFHEWLQTIPNPDKVEFDPNCGVCQRQRDGTAKAFDFHSDWSGSGARAWLKKFLRRSHG